jgi:hypothetical protein
MNEPTQTGKKPKKILKKAILIASIIFIVLVALVGYSYYKSAKTIKTSIDIIKIETQNLQQAAPKQDFIQAKKSLAKIEENVKIVQSEVASLNLPKVLPIIKDEIKAVENLVDSTATVLSSAQQLVDIGAEMYKDLGIAGKTFQELEINKLDSNQKGNIVVAIRQTAPVLLEIKEEVDKISDNIDVLLNSPWAKYLNDDIISKIEKITSAQKIFDFAALVSGYLPELVGYPNQANYLILLQNNTEMRPTGGFIGTYCLLQMKDSKIEKLFIDDVYNLDKTVKKTLFVDPPWQLEKWNDTSQWFLRDANWSPDFPTSGKKAQWFYLQESGSDLDFNATIAITPNFISDLIKLTGPITAHGITFDHANFVDLLEYRVEMEFRELGIPMSERKAVISELSEKLQDKLDSLPKEKWLDLANTLQKNLDEKHILLFFNDKDLQNIAKERGWAGEIRSSEGDYLMVVDANIGSLKTDSVMDKTIKYDLRKEQSSTGDEYLVGKVTLTYTNNGKFAWNLTRYRDYARIYVPQGSELIHAKGMMANDRTKEVGKVYTEEEFGKTVFGAFISIEPKETKKLIFEYKLPNYIKEQMDKGNYNLLAQKQPGTVGHPFEFSFNEENFQTNLREDEMVYYKR